MIILSPSRLHWRGVSRSSRTLGAGCGGRKEAQRAVSAPTKASSRTAKSCGPDSPTLGSSLSGDEPVRRWRLSSPALQGEHEAAVKTTAQGMPDCSGLACGQCRLLFLLQAGHGCGQHPAFPAPSYLSRAMSLQNSGKTCRGNAESPPLRCHAPLHAGHPVLQRRLGLSTTVSGILDRPVGAGR